MVDLTDAEWQADGTWADRGLRRLEDGFALRDIGAVCTLAAVHKNTHLLPVRRR